MRRFDAHAATDVTGFGLLGHLDEMLAEGLGAEIDSSAVPMLPGVVELAKRGIARGGSRTNLETAINHGVVFAPGIPEHLKIIFADAQTSGGLLVALSSNDAQRYVDVLCEAGHDAAIVGRMVSGGGITVE